MKYMKNKILLLLLNIIIFIFTKCIILYNILNTFIFCIHGSSHSPTVMPVFPVRNKSNTLFFSQEKNI